MSVAPVALLLPRVSAHVVAVRLPEAGLVVVAQLEAAYPLRALPEVEVRHEQPRGAAVLGVEWLVVVRERDPGPAAGQIFERQVGRIAAVRPRSHIFGARVDARQAAVGGSPRPDSVDLR